MTPQRRDILALVAARGPMSRYAIAKTAGIEKSTAGRHVAALLNSGHLRETAARPDVAPGLEPREGRVTEADLAPLAKAGDRRAVEELLRRVKPTVERIVGRTLQRVRTPFDVTDDAVSVGLRAVWRTIPAWPEGAGLMQFARENVRRAVLSIAYRRGFAVSGHAAPSFSLDAPLSDDSDTTAGDLLPAEDDSSEPAIDVARALSALQPRDVEVLMRHARGENFAEIGEALKTSRQYAHKVYHRAVHSARCVALRRSAA